MRHLVLATIAALTLTAGAARAETRWPEDQNANRDPKPLPGAIPFGTKSVISGATAYVDLQRVFAESEPAKKSNAELTALRQEKQKDLDAREAAIKKATVGSPNDVKLVNQAAVQKERDALNQLAQRYQGEVQAKQQEATAALLARVNQVVAKLAAERRLAVVLPGSPLYARPGLDITQDVIKRLAEPPPVAHADEVAKLRAELAAERAEKEALKSKVAPPPLPPSPAKPAATAAR